MSSKWVITRDALAAQFNMKSSEGVSSVNFEESDRPDLKEKFKMFDDDGVLYFEGVSNDASSEDAFAPLDDFGQPDSGCTEIQYLNHETGRYETL